MSKHNAATVEVITDGEMVSVKGVAYWDTDRVLTLFDASDAEIAVFNNWSSAQVVPAQVNP